MPLQLFTRQTVETSLGNRQEQSPRIVASNVSAQVADEMLGCTNIALSDAVGLWNVWHAEGMFDTCNLLDLVPNVILILTGIVRVE